MEKFDLHNWYIWSCNEFTGAFNMACDHFLARELGKLLDRPILRFFKWNPYCISLGYHQKPAEIDRELCSEQNIDLVRRPTGGRAILHSEELTYSVIYPFKSMDVAGFYRLIHLPFVAAINEYDIPAQFQPVQTDFKKFYTSDRSSVCFASSAMYEVEIEEKKLIGSAQRVYQDSILQHGSLLLGSFHEKLVEFLNIPSERRSKLQKYIQMKTAFLWNYRNDISAENLATQVQNKFTELLNIHFTVIPPELLKKITIYVNQMKGEFHLPIHQEII